MKKTPQNKMFVNFERLHEKDVFHLEVIKQRVRLNMPANGFGNEEEFNKWQQTKYLKNRDVLGRVYKAVQAVSTLAYKYLKTDILERDSILVELFSRYYLIGGIDLLKNIFSHFSIGITLYGVDRINLRVLKEIKKDFRGAALIIVASDTNHTDLRQYVEFNYRKIRECMVGDSRRIRGRNKSQGRKMQLLYLRKYMRYRLNELKEISGNKLCVNKHDAIAEIIHKENPGSKITGNALRMTERRLGYKKMNI